jgi:hypothetical protein
MGRGWWAGEPVGGQVDSFFWGVEAAPIPFAFGRLIPDASRYVSTVVDAKLAGTAKRQPEGKQVNKARDGLILKLIIAGVLEAGGGKAGTLGEVVVRPFPRKDCVDLFLNAEREIPATD